MEGGPNPPSKPASKPSERYDAYLTKNNEEIDRGGEATPTEASEQTHTTEERVCTNVETTSNQRGSQSSSDTSPSSEQNPPSTTQGTGATATNQQANQPPPFASSWSNYPQHVKEDLARSYGYDGRIAAYEREILLIADSAQSAVSAVSDNAQSAASAVSENESLPTANDAQTPNDTTAAIDATAAPTDEEANQDAIAPTIPSIHGHNNQAEDATDAADSNGVIEESSGNKTDG